LAIWSFLRSIEKIWKKQQKKDRMYKYIIRQKKCGAHYQAEGVNKEEKVVDTLEVHLQENYRK
jgi:hypothetical protein